MCMSGPSYHYPSNPIIYSLLTKGQIHILFTSFILCMAVASSGDYKKTIAPMTDQLMETRINTLNVIMLTPHCGEKLITYGMRDY